MRTFAYCRVSSVEQDTATQLHQIRSLGYDVLDSRCFHDVVSGSVPASQRPEFAKLVDRLEAGDRLVVLKLDRLGRDNMDVQSTVAMLIDKGIQVHCLDLPVPDLSSSQGKLMLQLFASFAEFERNRIKERTTDAMAKLKAEGVKLGRPAATGTTDAVQTCKQNGLSQSKTVAHLGISLATVKRHWNSGK